MKRDYQFCRVSAAYRSVQTGHCMLVLWRNLMWTASFDRQVDQMVWIKVTLLKISPVMWICWELSESRIVIVYCWCLPHLLLGYSATTNALHLEAICVSGICTFLVSKCDDHRIEQVKIRCLIVLLRKSNLELQFGSYFPVAHFNLMRLI